MLNIDKSPVFFHSNKSAFDSYRDVEYRKLDVAHKAEKSRVTLDAFDASEGLEREASTLKEVCWYLVKMLFFLSAFPFPSKLKRGLLRLFGARIGKSVVIKPRINIHMPWKLTIGDYSWVGEETFILNFEQVNIGNHVCVSQRVFLCCGNHDFNDTCMSYRNGPITLSDGCWVGASSFVGPDVSIGLDTVVCAASVITKSLSGNGVYRGNPAAFVKARWK
ncbi:MAG: WcaF family extracellular polysaccharide biosynthesis acetyltransferase [Bacteroidota bacterium]